MRTIYTKGMHAMGLASIALFAGSVSMFASAQAARQPSAADAIAKLADSRQYADALAAYDRQVTASSNRPDAALLAVIARAQLKDFAGGTDAVMSADALERLAAGGDDQALATLRDKASGPAGSDPAVAAIKGLLRLGDKATIARLAKVLESTPPSERAELIQTLDQARVVAAGPAIAGYLGDTAPTVRMAAAQAVGDLGVKEALPTLKSMFEKDIPTVKTFAAIALKRLGDRTADAYLADLLTSQVPDVRLMAAAAYPAADSRIWLPAVRELRNDRNELARVKAAERLACCDVPTARAILFDAFASPNPLMRGEAARVFDETGLGDARVARRLMGEAIDMLRLRGAGMAVKLARAPARGAGR
jgi:HEAT repeat protein